ncbi:MAG: AAA family ATPase [Clostridia bacterium]|nr:AAA family ATPase [Clostridia bacterium]MDD4375602.1 AAA family ATPase [Clostridia bacterium]
MQLKRVEIQGFKSFAEKTNVEFLDGITTIVGPNGSRKKQRIRRNKMGAWRTKCKKSKGLKNGRYNICRNSAKKDAGAC